MELTYNGLMRQVKTSHCNPMQFCVNGLNELAVNLHPPNATVHNIPWWSFIDSAAAHIQMTRWACYFDWTHGRWAVVLVS